MSATRASILGAVDGVITSFAIVSGSHAGSFDTSVVLVIGLSSLFADGFSMGVSEFLSSDIVVSKGRPAWVLGIACFSSFVIAGLIPILTFLWSASLLSSAMFSLVELMVFGAIGSSVKKEDILIGFFKTTSLGASAGAISYAVGKALTSTLN